MKKIINGKVYDTETAKELGYQAWNWGNNLTQKSETLYRKKTGEYFVYGHGGPMTEYAQPSGSSNWSDGSRIMPMSYSEARKWAEDNLSAEEYEAIFGAVAEDASRQTATYSLSAGTSERIRRRAEELGISASAYIEQLVIADK